MPVQVLSVVHIIDMQPLEGLARGVQPAVEVVAAEMETVLYAQMLALFAPQVQCTAQLSALMSTEACTCRARLHSADILAHRGGGRFQDARVSVRSAMP